MKKVSARFMPMLMSATMFVGVAAKANFDPSWERPILKAEMHEFDRDGHELGIGLDKVLTLHKRDGFAQPTSFSLVEEHKVFCVVAPCPPIKQTMNFKITSVTRTSFGGVKYTAVEERKFIDPRVRMAPPLRLEVTDVGRRILTGARYQWEASITGFQTNRHLVGNPEGVITIQ